MTRRWLSRLGFLLSLLLFVGALVFLQTSDAERDLVVCVPAFGAIALAALAAAATPRTTSSTDVLSLAGSASFFGYLTIRTLTSPSAYAARFDLYTILAALTVYGLTTIGITTPVRRITFILSLLAVAVVHVLVGIIQAGFGQNLMLLSPLETVEPSARAAGLYVNPDHLAGLLEVLGILALSIACWSRWPRWARVVIGYLAIVCYLGVIMSGSRAGYFSALASLALFALLSLIVLCSGGVSLLLRFGGGGLILLALAITASVFLIYQIPALKERVQSMVTDEGRLGLWQAAIEQWKLQPVTGTGSGTYLFYGRQFRALQMQSDPVDVHNDYLHLLCEYGLIGAAGFLLFFGAHLRSAWRAFIKIGPARVGAGALPLSDRLSLIIGALCAIGAYVVHSALDFNLHIPANALLLAFVFGIIAAPGVNEPATPTTAAIPRLATAILAAILLLQSARLFPGEHFAEKARTSLRDEDPTAAVSFANKALEHEQKNPNIFFYLGRALIAQSHDQAHLADRPALQNQALVAFEKAHALVPLDGTYSVEIGRTLDAMGRFAEAEPLYQHAISRDPRSVAVTEMYRAHREVWEKDRQKNPQQTNEPTPARD